ncbi:hypothetical protein AGMMS49942_23780 [Spirochaetia bacterium]|nr:hypothetical protein AGMMS49942_23780 [Spirochaetia bacterium]
MGGSISPGQEGWSGQGCGWEEASGQEAGDEVGSGYGWWSAILTLDLFFQETRPGGARTTPYDNSKIKQTYHLHLFCHHIIELFN